METIKYKTALIVGAGEGLKRVVGEALHPRRHPRRVGSAAN